MFKELNIQYLKESMAKREIERQRIEAERKSNLDFFKIIENPHVAAQQ